MTAKARHAAPVLPARLATPQPIFLEPSGRRWRLLQLAAVLAAVLFAGLAAWEVAPIGTMLREPLPGPTPESVVARLGSVPVVVGDGPLVRVAQIGAGRFTDPFTQQDLGAVSAPDRARARGAAIVVQRYGYAAADHRILLTFDDGPDPVWTPKLLDVLAREHVRATFFVTGRASVKYPDLVRRSCARGTSSPTTASPTRTSASRRHGGRGSRSRAPTTCSPLSPAAVPGSCARPTTAVPTPSSATRPSPSPGPSAPGTRWPATTTTPSTGRTAAAPARRALRHRSSRPRSRCPTSTAAP